MSQGLTQKNAWGKKIYSLWMHVNKLMFDS